MPEGLGEAKKKYDKIKNLPFFIGLGFVGVPLALSILTEIFRIIFTDADWRWYVVIIFGILALVMLLITKIPAVGKHPVVIILLLIFLGLELGFFIWVVVEKITEIKNDAVAYVGTIGQSISSNPDYAQIQQNVTQGQEAAGEQVDVGIGVWDKVLVFFDQLKGLGLNI